jgi:hypothetical protein
MNRFDFYFEQLVTEAQMDQAFEWVEEADWLAIQTAILGRNAPSETRGAIHWGAQVIQNAAPDLNVIVQTGGCSDPTGRHVSWTSDQLVDCSVDYLAVPTTVSSPGNEKYLGLFALWDRNLTDPTSDGNGLTVYFKQFDSFELRIVQGAEAGSGLALPPPTPTDAIRMTNIKLAYGTTQILNSDLIVDLASYLRDDYVRVTGVNLADFVWGNPSNAIAQLFAYVDQYSAGGSVTFTGSEDWHDGSGALASTNVQAAINEIVRDLAEDNAGAGGQWGSDKLGSDEYTTAGGYADLARGSIWDQLKLLADGIDGHVNGTPPFHPASAITSLAVHWLTSTELQGVVQQIGDTARSLNHFYTVSNEAELDAAILEIAKINTIHHPAVTVKILLTDNIACTTSKDIYFSGVSGGNVEFNGGNHTITASDPDFRIRFVNCNCSVRVTNVVIDHTAGTLNNSIIHLENCPDATIYFVDVNITGTTGDAYKILNSKVLFSNNIKIRSGGLNGVVAVDSEIRFETSSACFEEPNTSGDILALENTVFTMDWYYPGVFETGPSVPTSGIITLSKSSRIEADRCSSPSATGTGSVANPYVTTLTNTGQAEVYRDVQRFGSYLPRIIDYSIALKFPAGTFDGGDYFFENVGGTGSIELRANAGVASKETDPGEYATTINCDAYGFMFRNCGIEVRITDFYFNLLDAGASSTAAVYFNRCSSFYVSDCLFLGTDLLGNYGIYALDRSKGRIHGCVFNKMKKSGVLMYTHTYVALYNSTYVSGASSYEQPYEWGADVYDGSLITTDTGSYVNGRLGRTQTDSSSHELY